MIEFFAKRCQRDGKVFVVCASPGNHDQFLAHLHYARGDAVHRVLAGSDVVLKVCDDKRDGSGLDFIGGIRQFFPCGVELAPQCDRLCVLRAERRHSVGHRHFQRVDLVPVVGNKRVFLHSRFQLRGGVRFQLFPEDRQFLNCLCLKDPRRCRLGDKLLQARNPYW